MQKTTRGTYDYATDDKSGFIVVRWNDDSVVNVVSNCVGLHPVQTASRWSRAAHQRVQMVVLVILGLYVFVHHDGDFKDGGNKERAAQILPDGTRTRDPRITNPTL